MSRSIRFALLLAPVALLLALLVAAPSAASAAPAQGTTEPVNVFQFHWGKDVHGGELEPGDTPMPPPLAFMFLNFALFLGIVIWKGGPKIRSYLQQRHTEIKEALAEAARLREEAQQKLEQYSKRLKEADAEIDKLVSDIRKDADAEKKRILEQAEKQAGILKRDAEARIEAELARARAALEVEVVSAATRRAEELLQKNTSQRDQAALVDAFLQELKGPPGGEGGGSTSVDEEWS